MKRIKEIEMVILALEEVLEHNMSEACSASVERQIDALSDELAELKTRN